MIIKDHSQYSDDELALVFASYKLKPRLFSHEAHIRLAYIHITKYGIKQAEDNLCNQIKCYAESLGAFDKFNKTVTIASIKVMNNLMEQSNSNNFNSLIEQFPVLIFDFKGLLKKHYSFNVFSNQYAKQEYVEPDLLPFE